MSNANTVVYTAIYGGYDTLIDPRDPANDVDYVCFTDDESLESDVWDIRHPDINTDLPPNLRNRLLKILPHEYLQEYDYSVYIDGNVGIIKSLSPLIDRYRDEMFAAPAHSNRDCVYEEAKECIRLEKGEISSIRRQIDAYEKAGLPRYTGLTANRLLLRQHNDPAVRHLMTEWWMQLEKYSSRDQLSLPFVLWEHDFDITIIEDGPESNPNRFRIHPHLPNSQPKRELTKRWIQITNDRDKNLAYQMIYYAARGVGLARREGLSESICAGFGVLFPDGFREGLLALGDRAGVIGPDEIYQGEYYEKRQYDPLRSESHHMATVFKDIFEPDSVIDFGCAIGAYLEPFYEQGVTVRGVEANSQAFNYAVIPESLLTQHDLREPFEPDRQYDLVLSIEVAEHIPDNYADIYRDTLTKSGSTVIMSAAPPGQGGTHHVNEQPRDYWKEKMAEVGFTYDPDAVAEIRRRADADVFAHVAKNIMVFREDI